MNRELYIVNKEHPDFVRLYWSTDKEKWVEKVTELLKNINTEI